MRNDAWNGRWSRLPVSLACAIAVAVALPGGTASASPVAAYVPPAAASAADVPPAVPSVAAAQRDRGVWETRGHPAALVIARQTSIDLVDNGRLTRQIPRFGGPLTVPVLARYLPKAWLTVTGDTARLSAAVVLTPGVALDVGAPVTKLLLNGGATTADAASLYTGSGALALRGVAVSAVDHGSGQALTSGPGRPFILVSPAGRFTATDSTITNLGSAPTDPGVDPDVQDHPGVDFHAGSTGSLVRTSLQGNGTGLQLNGSQGVHLEDVTISGSSGAGLVLRGDQGTTMTRVRAEHNGTFGVRVTGPNSNRPITGISTTGNGDFGISLDKQTGTKITDVATSADATGGVEVQDSDNVTVTGLTTTDEPIGVLTHVNSANITLDRMTSTGGRRGVMIEKTTNKLTMSGSTITGASVAGVSVGGRNTVLHDMTVTNSQTGVRVERGAHGLLASAVTFSGGTDGVVASPATDGVVLQDLAVTGVENAAVRSSSPDARIIGGRFNGGATGIVVDAPTTISGTSIALADQGIRTQSPVVVRADDIDVNTVSVGINATVGSPLVLTGSRVHALEAVRGTVDAQGPNDISLPPLNLLGAIGLPLILLAVLLQMVAALRGRRFGGNARRTPPDRWIVAPGEAPLPEMSAPRAHAVHAA